MQFTPNIDLAIHRSKTGHVLHLNPLNGGERHTQFSSSFPHRQTIIKQRQDFATVDSLRATFIPPLRFGDCYPLALTFQQSPSTSLKND